MALILGGVLLFLLLGAAGYLATLYNGLVVVKNNILKAWGNIDVLLKQRHDEIPKLVKLAETYMKYEKDALSNIIALRNSASAAQGVASKAVKEGELTGALHKLFALSENYPDLKANASFQQLQNRISALENQIADRREFYNDSVNNYNIRIQSFPDLFVAGFMNLKAQEMFKVSEAERGDVSVEMKLP